MSNPIKLGIVGGGLAVKQLHWPALQRLRDRYEFIAVADIDPDAARSTADLIGAARTFADYHELLALGEIEAVLLSLPIHLTATVARDAARAGKHIIMEKPIGSNLEQAQALKDDLIGQPITVLVAENFRYRDDLRKARQLIDDGAIGEPILVRLNALARANTSDPQTFPGTPWRHDAQYRGGQMLDGGVHHAAALRDLLGEVEWVQGFTKYGHSALNGPTTLSANLRFRSGAIGSYLYSAVCHDDQGSFMTLNVYGSGGTIELRDGSLRLIKPDQAPQTIEVDGSDGGYYGEFVNFYDAIRTNAPVVATLDQSYRDMELILRAIDSAESASVILL